MNAQDRAEYIEQFLETHCRVVMGRKGQEYSRGEEDVNSNFHRLSDELGLTPQQVNWVYLKKHLDSIAYAIKTDNFVGTEPIEGRIGDAINYLFILASLIQERAEKEGSGQPHPSEFSGSRLG